MGKAGINLPLKFKKSKLGQAQQTYAKDSKMTKKKKEPTFAEKFGLKGEGTEVKIPEETRRLNNILDGVSETITRAGKNWAKGFKGTFGR